MQVAQRAVVAEAAFRHASHRGTRPALTAQARAGRDQRPHRVGEQPPGPVERRADVPDRAVGERVEASVVRERAVAPEHADPAVDEPPDLHATEPARRADDPHPPWRLAVRVRRRQVEQTIGAGDDHARAAVGLAVLVTGRAHGRADRDHAGRGQGGGPGDGERDRHAREQPAPLTSARPAGGHRRQLALELRDQGHCSPFRSAARPRLTRWRTTASEHSSSLAIVG